MIFRPQTSVPLDPLALDPLALETLALDTLDLDDLDLDFDLEFDLEEVNTRVSETAFLNAGLKINISDERSSEPHVVEHLYEGGLAEYVGQLNERREVLHSEVIKKDDPSEIVIDEWVGQWIALIGLEQSITWGFVAFFIFRLF